MHIKALILIACLGVTNAGAVGFATAVDAGLAGAAATSVALVPLAVPPGETPDAEPASPAPADAAGDPAAGPSPLQEIVAGVLTGSLAAVLVLRIWYGRRRRHDAR